MAEWRSGVAESYSLRFHYSTNPLFESPQPAPSSAASTRMAPIHLTRRSICAVYIATVPVLGAQIRLRCKSPGFESRPSLRTPHASAAARGRGRPSRRRAEARSTCGDSRRPSSSARASFGSRRAGARLRSRDWGAGPSPARSRRTPTRPGSGRSAQPRSGSDAYRRSGSLRSVRVELLGEKTEAERRISLARRGSRFSLRRRLISSRSWLVSRSERRPVSASTWRTRLWSASGWTPRSRATSAIGRSDSKTKPDAAIEQLDRVLAWSCHGFGDLPSSRTAPFDRTGRQTVFRWRWRRCSRSR